jgi:hypothetical protein
LVYFLTERMRLSLSPHPQNSVIPHFDEAKSLANLSDKSHSRMFSKILAYTSEQQRLAYQNVVNPNLYGLFSLLAGCEDDLASAVLRFKGKRHAEHHWLST